MKKLCKNILIIINSFLCLSLLFSSYTSFSYSDENPNNFGMKFAWPCKPKCEVVKSFDNDLPNKYAAGNRGIDLKINEGDFVYAPYDGKVFYIGKIDNKNIVSIKHENNIRTTYVGVKSSLRKDDYISKNEIIGIVDYENISSKSLHFGVILGKDTYLDPKLFLYEKIYLLPNIQW